MNAALKESSVKHAIRISDDLSLPLDVATEAIALVGIRKSGKTYGAGVLAEGFLAAEVQTVIIDQAGKFYGLRLQPDGVTPSKFDVVILGGIRGDVPLAPEGGALVADLVLDSGRSCIIDVSLFSKGQRQRFCTEFGERLWHRKKQQERPTVLHVMLEEAQLIVPQRIQSDDARMFGVWEEIARLGRNFGIGVTFISQRPQSVNKEVLSQVEILFAMRVNGKLERKAMAEWIVEKSGDVKLVEELSGLKKGEAYLWSPEVLGEFRRIRIAAKRTFDSSASPKVGERAVVRKPKPINLVELKQAMEAVREQAEQHDPTVLQRRVRQLEAELRKAQQSAPARAAKVETKEVPVITESDHRTLKSMFDRVVQEFETQSERIEMLRHVLNEHAKRAAPRAGERLRMPEPAQRPVMVARTMSLADAGERTGALPKGARDMLSALAATLLPGLSRQQVATLAGLKMTGGTFAKYLSILRTGGYVEDRGGQLAITEHGLAAIGGRPPAPQTTEELVAQWNARLAAGARAMLAQLVEAYPRGMGRSELATAVNIEASGGTFAKYVSTLRSNGLVENISGELRASDTLFPGAR